MANASRFFRTVRLPAKVAHRKPFGRLGVTRLDDRVTPSISIPLNAYVWTQVGPTPIGPADITAAQATPGNLTTAGRIFGLASPPVPATATATEAQAATQKLLTTTVGGGVWQSADGGVTWASRTDNLSDLKILDRANAAAPLQDRTLKMGALAYSPADTSVVWAGQGNPGFGDFYLNPGAQEIPGFSDINQAGRGLMKSTDGGATWSLIKGPPNGGFPAFEGVAIVKVVPHPTNPDICFVITQGQFDTQYGSGVQSAVWRTDNGGLTWIDVTTNLASAQGTSVPVDRFRPITDFTFNPQNPNIAYVAVGDPRLYIPGQAYINDGVYQTLTALEADPANITFRVSFGGTGGGSGTSPIPGATLGNIRVEVSPNNPSTVYATVTEVNSPAGGPSLRMYKSTDAGTNWSPIALPQYVNAPGGYGGYNQSLLIDPRDANRLVIAGRSLNPATPSSIYLSVDGGANWVNMSVDSSGKGPQQTIRRISWDAQFNLLAGTDGGAFRYDFPTDLSANGTWESLNGGPKFGLGVSEVVSVSVPAQTVNTYTASTYGNGTVVFNDPGDPVVGPVPKTITDSKGAVIDNPDYLKLFQPPVTDPATFGGSVQYDATNPNIVYRAVSRTNGGGRVTIVQSTDGGKTWAATAGQPADPNNSSYDQPAFELDPGDSRRLVVGTDRVQISENSGQTWAADISLRDAGTGATGPIYVGGPQGELPLVTNYPAPYANPGIPVTAIGQSRSNFRVVYVAVQDRARRVNNFDELYGPAIYRIDTTFPEDTPRRTAYWRDVSPNRTYDVPLTTTTPPTDPFPTTLGGLPGFPLPGQPGVPMGFQVPAWGMPNGLKGIITDILVDPTDENIVTITVDTDGTVPFDYGIYSFGVSYYNTAIGSGRVYRSENGGQTWTDIGQKLGALPGQTNASLPTYGNLRPYTAVLDPNTPGTRVDDTLYIGTSTGVWSLTNPTTTLNDWVRVGQVGGRTDNTTGLPDVQVTDLRINTTTGLLTAGTFGRGVWQYQIRPLVSGSLFEDLNGNGIRDNDSAGKIEPARSGATVQAYDVVNDTPAASTVSASNGFYEFRSLPNGTYRIQVLGGTDFPTTGVPPAPNVYSVTQNTTIPGDTGPGGVALNTPAADLGTFRKTTISGVLFNDLNGNGRRDAGEPGLANLPVRLVSRDKNGNLTSPAVNPLTNSAVPTVTTDNSGVYTFVDLVPVQDKSATLANGSFYVNTYEVQEILPATKVRSSTATTATGIRLTSNVPFVTDTDIGVFTLVNLTGSVFDDTNGNGLRGGEPALGGVTVRLVTAGADGKINTTDDVVLGTQVSDANGAFAFPNLGPGSYYLQEVLATLPGSYRPTSGTVSSDGKYAVLGPIVPTSGQIGLTADFGNFRDAGLSGTVFEDDNGDGQRQLPLESRPVVGATVILLDGNKNPILVNNNVVTTTTDANGFYTFVGLQPQVQGNGQPYYVRVTAPADLFLQTSADAKATLSSGIVTGGLNLGYFRRTTISGFAFEDTNGNGLQDAGEQVAAGFPVSLLNSTDPTQVVATAVTLPTGQYLFAYDPANPTAFSGGPLQLGGPGGAVLAYRIAVNVAGVIQTNAPGDLVLTSGIPAQGPVLALFRTVGFNGTVYDDTNGDGVRQAGEPGLAGVTVDLVTAGGAVAVNPASGLPITATTRADGGYNLQAPNGTFTVRLRNLPGGTIQTSAAPIPITTTSGKSQPAIDLGTFRTFAVAGKVFTDTNGNGRGDLNEPGLGGITVRLVTSTGQATPYTATTDGSGVYTISGVGPGSFLLSPDLPAGAYYTQPTGPVPFTAVSGLSTAAAGVATTFGVYAGATISGTVFEDLNRNGLREAGEPGSAGWLVQVLNAAGAVLTVPVTDANGNFVITSVPPGATSLRLADRAGFVPTRSPVTLTSTPPSGGSVTAPLLGGVRLGSVSGRVFNDANRNALLDNSETGLGGVVVELVQSGAVLARQTSAADGSYAFLGLAAGSYTTRVQTATIPAGRVQTGPQTDGLVYTATVTEGTGTSGNAVLAQNFGVAGRKRYAVAADGGGGPRVQVYDAVTQVAVSDQFVYEESFTGGVRVASADVTGDGVDDLITVAGKGGGPRVRVLDGVTGAEVYGYFAYEPTFRDGLFVAAADVNGDGFADIITGTDSGGGPRVTVYSGKDGRLFLDFFAFDESFRGGVRIGAGDIDGDGRAEIIVGSGIGLAAEVRAFNSAGTRVTTFNPVDPSFTGGVYVAGGATDPFTGRASILVGTGAGYADQGYALVFDNAGSQLFQLEALPAATADAPLYRGDVRVGAFDTTGDGVPEIVIASGAGARSQVRFLDGNNRREIGVIFPFEAAFLGGLFVG